MNFAHFSKKTLGKISNNLFEILKNENDHNFTSPNLSLSHFKIKLRPQNIMIMFERKSKQIFKSGISRNFSTKIIDVIIGNAVVVRIPWS